MTAAAFWFVQSVDAEPYLGSGQAGERWDTSRPVDAWVEEGNHLVIDGKGNTVVASTAVYAAIADRLSMVANSKVTTPTGKTSRVITLEVHDSGSLALGVDHVVAHLQ